MQYDMGIGASFCTVGTGVPPDSRQCAQLSARRKRPCANTRFMSSFFLRFLLMTVHILHSITSQPPADHSCDNSSTVK